MKKISKSLAASLMLSSMLAPAAVFAADFPDLDRASFWATDDITRAKQMGLVNGDDSGKFRPMDNITRQEVAAIVARILHLDSSTSDTNSFTDTAGQWGKNYIEAVHKAGLMNGDGNNTFRPNDKITREELAVLLVRSANGKTEGKAASLTVADKNQISPWSKDYVQAAIELGLMKGDGDNFFPRNLAHREEIAVTAVRLFGYLGLHTVSDITADSATINGVTWQLSDQVKPILKPANLAVLRNAKIRFETSNKTITKISNLELMNSGVIAVEGTALHSGNLVLDGGNGAVDGNVTVNGSYVTLQNLIIKGNLEIAQGLQQDFYSKNLKVEGMTYINGGSSNTVTFDNSTLASAQVNKANVKVQANGTTSVDSMFVKSNSTIAAGVDAKIKKIMMAEQATSTLQGTFEKVEIDHPEAQLDLAETARIKELVLHEPVDVATVVKNYEAVKGQIDKVTSVPAAPVITNVSVVDEVAAEDTITVKGLMAGDTVNLYNDKDSAEPLQTVTVETGTTAILKLNMQTVGEDAFLTIVRNGVESARREVTIVGVTVSSTEYEIDNLAGTITGAAGKSLTEVKSNLVTSTGAMLKVYTDNTLASEVTTGNVAAGNIVVVTKGQITKKFEIK